MPIINLVYEWYKEWWKPWANTKFYLPLKNDILDHSWNNVSTSTSWTITYQNPWALISWWIITVNYNQNPSSFTISFYSKCSSVSSPTALCNQSSITSAWYYWFDIVFNADNRSGTIRAEAMWWGYTIKWKSYYAIGVTDWHHYLLIIDNNQTWYFYIDNVLQESKNISWFVQHSWNILIWDNWSYMWDVIYEDKARSEEERTSYFNQTKWNYGL